MATAREELEALVKVAQIEHERLMDDMALMHFTTMTFDVIEVLVEMGFMTVPLSVELAQSVTERLREVTEARHGHHGCH